MLLPSNRSRVILLGILPLVLLFAVTITLTSGTVSLTLSDLFSNELSPLQHTVLWQLRIPRIVVTIGVGGGLALAGLFVQALFHNPLVEPYTLGISGGASLAVATATVLGFSNNSYSFAAFIGAATVTSLLWVVSSLYRGSTNRLLLFGVMISFIASSFLVLIFSLVQSEQLQQIIFWTMGSLEPSGQWVGAPLVLLGMVLALGATLLGRQLNLLSLGDEHSHVAGINTALLRLALLMGATLLTALAVSLAGIIGFVGLLIPHTARAIWGGDHRFLAGASFLGGAIFLLLTDTIARTVITPAIIPVGAITGIIGGILFMFLLLHKKRGGLL